MTVISPKTQARKILKVLERPDAKEYAYQKLTQTTSPAQKMFWREVIVTLPDRQSGVVASAPVLLFTESSEQHLYPLLHYTNGEDR